MKVSKLILKLQEIYRITGKDLDVVKYEEPTDSIQPVSNDLTVKDVRDFYGDGWETIIL